MKKILLPALLAICVTPVMAQSSFSFTDNGTMMNVTNQVVTYWVSDSVSDSRTFAMTNTSANAVTVKVRKTNMQLNDPGATTWFCTDINCYSSVTTLSLGFTIAPGGTSVLTTDFNPNFATGVTKVRYTIINQGDANDTANIEIDYNMAVGGLAGLNHVASFKPVVSQPIPNPASGIFKMNYELGNSSSAVFTIYNMVGSKVKTLAISENAGQLALDVADMENGIYFCTFEVEGKAIATRRLIVSH